MERDIFAVIEHRKLMELKNSGAVDAYTLDMFAEEIFKKVKAEIVAVRKSREKDKSKLARFFSFSFSIEKDVDLMFTTRGELVSHLSAVEVPTRLCPISQELKDQLLFIDRAALYAHEAREILDMFKRHNEVIVDQYLSTVVDWILQNAYKVRTELSKGV